MTPTVGSGNEKNRASILTEKAPGNVVGDLAAFSRNTFNDYVDLRLKPPVVNSFLSCKHPVVVSSIWSPTQQLFAGLRHQRTLSRQKDPLLPYMAQVKRSKNRSQQGGGSRSRSTSQSRSTNYPRQQKSPKMQKKVLKTRKSQNSKEGKKTDSGVGSGRQTVCINISRHLVAPTPLQG